MRQWHQRHWISSSLCLISLLAFALTTIGLKRARQIEATLHPTQRKVSLPAPPCVATSDDCRHVFEDNGQFHSHHIDPRSGMPVPLQVGSVSVLADDCPQADPLGSTPSVPGAEQGVAYALQHGLAVLMIVRTAQGFEQRMSAAFARALQP